MNERKIDEMVLALLYLGAHRDHDDVPWRAWKGFDWDALNRLHEQGLIGQPRGKAKSVMFTEAGFEEAQRLFSLHFDGDDEQP